MSGDTLRDMRFLITMLFRPPMQVRIAYLTALRIMMVRSHVQTAQTTFRGRKESVRQFAGLPVVSAFYKERFMHVGFDIDPKCQRRRVLPFRSPTNSGRYSFRVGHDSREFRTAQRHASS